MTADEIWQLRLDRMGARCTEYEVKCRDLKEEVARLKVTIAKLERERE